MQLIGEYPVKVDEKGRILVPAMLRKQLPAEMQDRFVLTRGFENCVAMKPYPVWQKELAEVMKLNYHTRNAREFQRFFVNGAAEITLDTMGRMLIPKHLQEWASLGREVVISTYGDKIEIWAREKFRIPTATDAEAFADLAEKLFGGNKEGGQ